MTCKIKNCLSEGKKRSMCHKHYNAWHRKQNPESYRQAEARWLKKNPERRKLLSKKWHKENPGHSTPYMHKARFGGLRKKVLERDGFQCIECGMSQREHKDRWGRDLTIDHIDGSGRYSDEQNNSMQNLQTMCLSCHGRKDVARRISRPVRGGVNDHGKT